MMHELPRTRPSLLLRLRGGRDEQAWFEFLAIYEPLLMRLMRRKGLQDSDARDVTQQALLRIYSAIDGYEPDGAEASFRRWLFRVARNVALTFLTRQARSPASLSEPAGQVASDRQTANSVDSDLFDEEYRQQVFAWAMEHVRREFHDHTWQAFVESAVLGRPIADVASLLKMSPGSIYVARSRIIARLRAKVEEFEAEA